MGDHCAQAVAGTANRHATRKKRRSKLEEWAFIILGLQFLEWGRTNTSILMAATT